MSALQSHKADKLSLRFWSTTRHSRIKLTVGSSLASTPVNTLHVVWILSGTADRRVPFTRSSQISKIIWTGHLFTPPGLPTGLSLLISIWIVLICSRTLRWCDSLASVLFASSRLSFKLFNNSRRLRARELVSSNLIYWGFTSFWAAYTAIFATDSSACSSSTQLYSSSTVFKWPYASWLALSFVPTPSSSNREQHRLGIRSSSLHSQICSDRRMQTRKKNTFMIA